MNNPGNPSFTPFVVPWGQFQPHYPAQRPHEEVPARVQVAMDFYQQMMVKTMERAAVNDLAIEWAAPKELCGEESDALKACCRLLEAYFDGSLKPTRAEKLLEEQQKRLGGPEAPGNYLNCPECHGACVKGGLKCRICNGSGTVIIYPGNKEE